MKHNKSYRVINIVGALVCVMLIAMLFVFNEQKVLIGVLFRGAFTLLIIYNSLYTIFTDKLSFVIRKGQEKHRKLIGIILLVVGIFGFVTVLMGYGINGYPLLDWKSVFRK